MLNKLTIKNIALIDYAEIDFTKGLNVLSGETGSGKSVIIESLNFVLGSKADKALIKNGETECVVSAFFTVENETVVNLLKELDIDDCEIIITRKMNIDGKSSLKINGEPVTSFMLKKITSEMVDVHGQSEHFSLLKNSNQLALIDKVGGENILSIKSKVHELYSEYKNVISSLETFGKDDASRLIKLDIINFQIEEIEKAEIKEGEEEKLLQIKSNILNQEKIVNALNGVVESINGEGCSQDLLSNSLKMLSSISNLSTKYSELYNRFSEILTDLGDVKDTAENYLDEFEENEYSIDYVESRLDTYKKLKKKYGNSVDEIFNFLDEIKAEKDILVNFNEKNAELIKQKSDLESELFDLYKLLSNEREKVAKSFEIKIISELKDLNIVNADFSVEFHRPSSIDDCKFNSLNGFDEVEFMFSANLGEPLKPLSNIISGGEISRFMLGIKAETAKFNDISTFIFDEIDSGISGITAKIVANKFADISKYAQIIAISHLPQISAMADNNLLIKKIVESNKTFTRVEVLDNETKVSEIVRLTGGIITDSAINHAKELIKEASAYKNK